MESFVETYKLLYKSLAAPEVKAEDFERLLEIAVNATNTIEKILTDENLPRNKKFSLETSLGHFVTIQLKLRERMKQGGELISVRLDTLNSVALDNSVSNSMDEQSKISDQVNDSNIVENQNVKWSEISSAFKKRIKTGVISNIKHLDYDSFMNDAKVVFETEIKEVLKEFSSIKVNTSLMVKYAMQKTDKEEEVDVKQFNTKNITILQTTNIDECFEEDVRPLLRQKISVFQAQGSGWSLQAVLHLAVNINKYNPMRVGCNIQLPEAVKNRNACIKVQNDDKQCFKWAVLAGLNKDKKLVHPERLYHYKPIENSLNFEGIEFPVTLKDLFKFERQNDVSINVYVLNRYGERYDVSPLYLTSFKQENHVNLLLIQDYYVNEYEQCYSDDNESLPEYHFVTIKSLSRLVRAQLSGRKSKVYICDRCLHFFWTQEKLDAHELDCAQNNKCKIILPKNRWLTFENFNRKERVSVVIYADIECLIKPREETQPERVVSNHQAFSIGYYAKYSFDDSLSKYESYRQLDETMQTPAEWFVEHLKTIAANMEKYLADIKPMELTQEDWREYNAQDLCHICKKPFTQKDIKVRDHCHLTGR